MKAIDMEYCEKCENETYYISWTPTGYESECTKCGNIVKLNKEE